MNDPLFGADGFINGTGPKIPGGRRAAHTWLCDGGHARHYFRGTDDRRRPTGDDATALRAARRSARHIWLVPATLCRRQKRVTYVSLCSSRAMSTLPLVERECRRGYRGDGGDANAGSPRNRPKSRSFSLRSPATTERFLFILLFLRASACRRQTFNDPIWGHPTFALRVPPAAYGP